MLGTLKKNQNSRVSTKIKKNFVFPSEGIWDWKLSWQKCITARFIIVNKAFR